MQNQNEQECYILHSTWPVFLTTKWVFILSTVISYPYIFVGFFGCIRLSDGFKLHSFQNKSIMREQVAASEIYMFKVYMKSYIPMETAAIFVLANLFLKQDISSENFICMG